jgi:hypothetical protein
MHDMSNNKFEEFIPTEALHRQGKNLESSTNKRASCIPTEELMTAENLILTTDLIQTESLKLIITAKLAAG